MRKFQKKNYLNDYQLRYAPMILQWLKNVFDRYSFDLSEWEKIVNRVTQNPKPFVWYVLPNQSNIFELSNETEIDFFRAFYESHKLQINIPVNGDRKLMKRLIYVDPTRKTYRKVRRLSDVLFRQGD